MAVTSRKRRAIIALVATASLGLSAVMCGSVAQADPSDVASASAHLQDVQAQADEAQAQLDDLQMRAEAASEKHKAAALHLAELDKKMAGTTKKVEDAKAQLAATQTTIGQIAATAYRSGGIDTSLQLLLAESPEDFLMQSAALSWVADSQNTALRKTQSAKLKLAQALAEQKQTEADQAAVTADLEAQKQEVLDLLQQQTDLVNNLQGEVRDALEAKKKAEAAESARLAAIALKKAQEAAAAARAEAQRQAEAEAARQAALEAQQAAEEQAAQEQANQDNSGSTDNSGNSDNSGGSGSSDNSGSSSDSGNSDSGSSDSGNSGSGDNSGSGGDTSWSGSSGDGGGGSSSAGSAAAVEYALAQVGKPYVDDPPGANPPYSWDCSKLTAAAWAQAGVGLTAYSYAQANEVQRVSVDSLQPGDILFFFEGGSHHVAMYIGDGQMVHAANSSLGVIVSSFQGGSMESRFSFAGRP